MRPKHRVGVVADDITGSNDIGVMLAKNGYRAGVFSLHTAPGPSDMEGLDAVILNTDSRLDDPGTAARKTARACQLLMALPCDVYHSKTCSVFRGNIGAQFDAMRAALGVSCSMVVLGFPKNGRTTVDGIHYVEGVPLAQSMFRNDPIHPMTESSLSAILKSQSRGSVCLFDHTLLDLPEDLRAKALADRKTAYNYVIFDVRDQRDLQTIARLIADEKSICGSSAICEELPKEWAGSASQSEGLESLLHPICDPTGTLIVSGSLTAPTRAQVEDLLSRGCFAHKLPTWLLFDEIARQQAIEEAAAAVSPVISKGSPAVLYAAQSPDEVAQTVEAGRAKGLDRTQVGRLVSQALCEAVRRVVRGTGLKKVVAAGGETSAAVSEALSLRKMVILSEIEPGVPAMYGYDRQGNETLLVFKSGSFGSAAFLHRSVTCLARLEAGLMP